MRVFQLAKVEKRWIVRTNQIPWTRLNTFRASRMHFPLHQMPGFVYSFEVVACSAAEVSAMDHDIRAGMDSIGSVGQGNTRSRICKQKQGRSGVGNLVLKLLP
jgi:hypothetical protein